jgi:luciferase family oxidoreductase group 1
MAVKFDVGVFDICRLSPQKNPVDTIWETIKGVSHAESCGFSRYWLGEHYTNDVAYGSPELLVPVLAGVTERIRIGTTSLLRCHSPFRLASDFRLLESIFPNRIDLGIGRGSVSLAIRDLLMGSAPEGSYEQRVADLAGFLRGTGDVPAFPRGVAPPDLWLLGRKGTSMGLAAQLGIAFCLTLFLDPIETKPPSQVIRDYCLQFKPSLSMEKPSWSIAIAGACAHTESLAQKRAEVVSGFFPSLIGTPAQCKQKLVELSETYATSRFMFLDSCVRFEDRMESYSLLSEALGLC